MSDECPHCLGAGWVAEADESPGESSDMGEADSDRPTDRAEPRRHDSPGPGLTPEQVADIRELALLGNAHSNAKVAAKVPRLLEAVEQAERERDEAVERAGDWRESERVARDWLKSMQRERDDYAEVLQKIRTRAEAIGLADDLHTAKDQGMAIEHTARHALARHEGS